MAKGVVDVLEVVQVQEHHTHQGALASSLGQRQLQAIQGQHPVGQAGQDVVVGLAQQLLLIPFSDADVFAKDQVAGRAA